MNKTKTTRDKERDANHQIKRGNTQNTSEGKKKEIQTIVKRQEET